MAESFPKSHSTTDVSNSSTMLAHLEQRGFVAVPDVVDANTIAQLVHELTETLKTANNQRTRRTGYALRQLTQTVPAVKALAQSPAIRSLVAKVLSPKALIVRSLFFDKTPDANWKVAWHQDLTIAVQKKIDLPGFGPWSVKEGVIHVQPPTSILARMLTIRLHLDDCGSDNGPLQVIAGSHKHGKLNAERIFELRKNAEPIPCTTRSRGAILMRPLLLHASSPSSIPNHRRVIHLEFAEESLPAGLQWAL